MGKLKKRICAVIAAALLLTPCIATAEEKTSTIPAVKQVEKAIGIVEANNLKYKKDKYSDDKSLTDKLGSLMEKSRKDIHKEAVKSTSGEAFIEAVSSSESDKSQTKEAKHKVREEQAKQLKKDIDAAYKNLKAQVTDTGLSRDIRKKTIKELGKLRSDSKDAVTKILNIYADEGEFTEVTAAVQSVWGEVQKATPTLESLSVYSGPVKNLNDAIVSYSFGDNYKIFVGFMKVILVIIILVALYFIITNFEEATKGIFRILGLILSAIGDLIRKLFDRDRY